MSTLKTIYNKHREKLWYIVFGVLTTLVGWATFTGVIWAWRAAFSLPTDDNKSQLYFVGFVIAQVLHWVAAVLFAFFTNKKWVFTDADKNVSTWVQLLKFAGGRVVTFFIDTGVTLGATALLVALFPFLQRVEIVGIELNFCDIGSKVITGVIVLVCNYFISKIFVFTKKKKSE